MNDPRAKIPAGFSLARHDEAVGRALERMQATRNVPPHDEIEYPDPYDFSEFGFSIDDVQGNFIYLLCRAIGARRVVDFATSIGVSAIYMAAAMRDNGGGLVIGAELVEARHAHALVNLRAAGLEAFTDIRLGDARETLAGLDGPLDFVLIDGWPMDQPRSLALEIIELLTPKLRKGAIVVNDNGEDDYLAFVRHPKSGFRSCRLPLNRGTEFSVKL